MELLSPIFVQIEKLHRDRQLRTAQLTALQQREESFRTRLLSSLQEYSHRVRIAAPGFAGLSRVAKHRLVYDALQKFTDAGLHALAIEIKA